MKKIILTIAMLLAFSAYSATITNVIGGSAFPANDSGSCFTLEGSIDFSKVTVASNDTIQVITVPANSYVLSVQYRVATATTTNYITTFDVGDGTTPAGWASDISTINTGAGWQASAFTSALTSQANTNGAVTNVSYAVTGYSAGKFYATSDTIDVHVDNAVGAIGKVDVSAVIIRTTKK